MGLHGTPSTYLTTRMTTVRAYLTENGINL